MATLDLEQEITSLKGQLQELQKIYNTFLQNRLLSVNGKTQQHVLLNKGDIIGYPSEEELIKALKEDSYITLEDGTPLRAFNNLLKNLIKELDVNVPLGNASTLSLEKLASLLKEDYTIVTETGQNLREVLRSFKEILEASVMSVNGLKGPHVELSVKDIKDFPTDKYFQDLIKEEDKILLSTGETLQEFLVKLELILDKKVISVNGIKGPEVEIKRKDIQDFPTDEQLQTQLKEDKYILTEDGETLRSFNKELLQTVRENKETSDKSFKETSENIQKLAEKTSTELEEGLQKRVASVNGKEGLHINLSREDLGIPSDKQLLEQNKEDLFVLTETGRNLREKNRERISVLDFGAIGDGTLHTVAELITLKKYKDLAEIQEEYTDVTSLTDSLDWAATMRGIRYLISRGGGSLYFPNIGEAYVFNQSIQFPANTQNITLLSDDANLYMDGVRIAASDPESVSIKGFDHIRFNENTNNGISFARPKHCTVDVNRVTGAGNFLVLFFAADELVFQCMGNFIRVKYADGLNVSKGGLGMAGLYMSRIEGSVTGVTEGIGYAVNFKNNCIACSADVVTTRNKLGLVLSNDTGEGVATGVNSSTFTVTSYQDKTGASVHRSQRNVINLNYTGSGLATDKALGVAAHCQDNTYNIKAYNGHSDSYIFTTRSDKQDVHLFDTDYTFGKIGLFEPATDYCNVFVYGAYSYTGNGFTISDYFTIDPTCRRIMLQQLADAPNVIHDYDTETKTESWQQGRLHIPVVGVSRPSNYISYGTSGGFTFRTQSGDIFGYNSITKSFDSIDQHSSLGRSGRHYTGVFAQKVMYTNTLGDFFGSGSPEGVVSASVGSTYRRTDGNTTGNFYIKKTGSAATGWVAVG